ncbi:MAG TPA: STAS domain-containing protein [Methanospirillum sp.]|nr:STAS domain-containing protein [Methanospirillum sp.]
MTPYTIRIVESIPVIELPSRIDSVTSGDLEKHLTGLIADKAVILCDFTHNTYISSLGLRVLLSTLKNLKRSGGILALCSLSPYVQEIFDISGFSRIFSIYSSESEAIPALASKTETGGNLSPQEG